MACEKPKAPAFRACKMRPFTPPGWRRSHRTQGGGSGFTTPIRQLDAASSQATTASGRRYTLGRRIQLEDVPGEGEEAWIAFDLLIGADAADGDAVPPISADPGRDVRPRDRSARC
jgi:hypothetical protein